MSWRERRRLKRCRFTAPPTHSTNLRVLVAQIYSGEKGSLKMYRRKLGECPLKVTDKLLVDEKVYVKLVKAITKADARDLIANNWIRAGTWSLIDEQARLRQNGELGNAMARTIGRKIKASLKEDQVERAQKCKGGREKAWKCVQGWYRKLSGQQQKQYHEVMMKQTLEREALCANVQPPGDCIPRTAPPSDIDNEDPQDEEIRPVVVVDKNGKAKGVDLVQAKNIKIWPGKMTLEEDYEEDAIPSRCAPTSAESIPAPRTAPPRATYGNCAGTSACATHSTRWISRAAASSHGAGDAACRPRRRHSRGGTRPQRHATAWRQGGRSTMRQRQRTRRSRTSSPHTASS